MDLDYLTLDILYNIDNDQFKVYGNVNLKGQRELVETFLREQIGAGEDEHEAKKKDVYNIRLKWYPKNDRISVISDTGNKGLRDGILLHYLKSLDE